MMNYAHILRSYLKYRKNAVNAYGVHAPFLFNLLQDVIYQKSDPADFAVIEKIRRQLLKDNSLLRVRDFGAGSRADKGSSRKISKIAKYSAKPPRVAALIYRLVKHFQPRQILEIGTSFGVSTMYMSLAMPEANIVSMEGCPETLAVAKRNFQQAGMENIRLIEGNFDEILPAWLETVTELDFVFFDGNHLREPTLRYFEACLAKAQPQSVFIFDDIHWSEEMEAAWEEIKKHPKVKLTLDLYSIGIVFFRKELSKEDFVVRF